MPDQMNIPLDKESANYEDKPDRKKEAAINSALDALSSQLNHKLGEYVSMRYAKEREWQIAEEQYNGATPAIDDKKLAAIRENRAGELPNVNITRPKTNIAIARMQDIQFASSDFNFCIKPTPVPELYELAKSEEPVQAAPPMPAPTPVPPGNEAAPPMPGAEAAPMPEMPGMEGAAAPPGPTVGDVAQQMLRDAKDRASKMERKIRDRMVETKWAKRSRQAMQQWGVLGTAVMKAPVLVHGRKRKYQKLQDMEGSSIYDLLLEDRITPTVQWVDTRMVFPAPSTRAGMDPEDCFELHLMTKKELRDLAFNPGFYENRIRDCLMEEPNVGHMAKSHILPIMGTKEDALDKRYCVMEYHGPMDKDVLFELDLISEESKNDPLVMLWGEVWFVNNRVIRVSVSPIEGDDTIPYYFCQWEEDPASIFGFGVPYMMRHAQRVMSSTWLMLLDNAGLTAGPQIVLNKEMIEPANKSEGWNIRPMKIWFMTEYGANVNEAMQFVDVPTQQESLANIIEMALNFSDIESSLPQIQQGEAPNANNITFGGMAMVLSAANIIQTRLSERWEDNIVIPIVEKLYHYEMQYGEDDSMKGDYEVHVGGATQRINQQIRGQDLERIMGMAGQNPEYQAQLDLPEAFREWVETTRVGTHILKPREVVEQEMAQAAQAAQEAPDADLIEAQARQMQAEAAMAKIELDREMKQMEFDLRAAIEEARVDKENREILARQEENQIKLHIAQMERENMLIDMANKNQLSQAELANKLGVEVMKAETQRLAKQADLDMFNTEINFKKTSGRDGI